MGKTAKLKKGSQPSIHSRAARRSASEPDANHVSAVADTHMKSNFFAPHESSGISKKQKQQIPLKRKQRLRLESGREKGESVRDKSAVKVSNSISRGEGRRKRRRKWEEIDDAIRKTFPDGRSLKNNKNNAEEGEQASPEILMDTSNAQHEISEIGQSSDEEQARVARADEGIS